MSMIKQKPIKYDDGRTKQAFKDSTDINKILKTDIFSIVFIGMKNNSE